MADAAPAWRGLLSQSAASVVIAVATIALQITLARQLGPSVLADYAIATSAAGIAFLVQDGGFRAILFREAVRPTPGLPDHRSLFAGALGWTIMTTVLLLIVSVFGGLIGLSATKAIALLLIANAGRVVSLEISSLLRADGRFSRDAIWQVANRLAVTGAMIVLCVFTGDLIAVLLAGAVAQLVLLLVPVRGHTLVMPRFTWQASLLKTSLTLIAIDFITTLYFRSDVLLMAALNVGKESIGVYSALTRIVEAYIFFVAPFAAVFFRSARAAPESGRNVTGSLIALIITVSVPAIVLLAFATQQADRIVVAIFGDEYRSGATYLSWMIAACCFAGPNALFGQALLARNREKQFLIGVTAALAVNIGTNLWLIPGFGAAGAAFATFATELVLSLSLIVALTTRSRGS